MADKIVEIPNIGPVSFPEGMSDADIIKFIQTLKSLDPLGSGGAQAAAPEPQGKMPESFGSKVLNSPVGGVIRGLRDIPDAGAQLLTRGLEGISPAGSGMEEFFRGERRRVEDINRQAELDYQANFRRGQMLPGEIDVGRVGGNILSALIPSTAAIRALGATTAPVRAGAIAGGVGGTLQPVATPPSRDTTLSDLVTDTRPQGMTNPQFFAQKVEQVGAGTALGAGAGYLGDKLSNILFGAKPPPMPMPGQPTVSGAQVNVTTTPTATGTGGGSTLGAVGPDPSAGLTAAQRAILARGKEMGFRTTPGQETGSRSLQQMEARMESNPFTSGPFNTIKAENQRILNRSTARSIGINADELSNPQLAEAQRQISNVYQRVATPDVKKLDGNTIQTGVEIIDKAFEGLTTQPFKSNIFVKQLQDLAIKGEASGNQLQTLSSKIGKRAKNEMTTAMGDRELGSALFQIKEIVDDALAQGLSSQEQLLFQTARTNYRNLMTIRSNQGVINPSTGNVSGLNLASALTRKDPQGFVFGANQTPMYEAARFAQAFRPIVGDSGTATRSMDISPLSMMLAAPTNIAARAYTSQPAANLASSLQTGVAPRTSPATQEMLRRMFPSTGALGLLSLIGQ
jgi:hypothetical protein